MGNVVTIDDERIKSHLDRVVRGSVEETLNALLDAEADRLCNAERYERSEARRDRRAGHYERKLQTKAGEVKLRIPKLRAQTLDSRAKCNRALCEPDLHVFAKLFEDCLKRSFEAQAFSGREIGGNDDVLDFLVGHFVDVDLTRQPAS